MPRGFSMLFDFFVCLGMIFMIFLSRLKITYLFTKVSSANQFSQ